MNINFVFTADRNCCTGFVNSRYTVCIPNRYFHTAVFAEFDIFDAAVNRIEISAGVVSFGGVNRPQFGRHFVILVLRRNNGFIRQGTPFRQFLELWQRRKRIADIVVVINRCANFVNVDCSGAHNQLSLRIDRTTNKAHICAVS